MKSVKCVTCGFVSRATSEFCKSCGNPYKSPAQQSTQNKSPRFSTETNILLQPDDNLKQEAFKKIKYGIIGTIVYVIVLFLISFSILNIKINPLALGTGLLPVAWVLAGVIELLTGIPFIQLSNKWDSLAGWQRGLIGLSVFILGLVAIFILGMAILFILDGPQRFR